MYVPSHHIALTSVNQLHPHDCSRMQCCNTLQQTATHCNTLQHTAAHCSTLQHTAAHCNTLQLLTALACSAAPVMHELYD